MQKSSLDFLGCSSVRVLFARCFRGKLKTRVQILFEPPLALSKKVFPMQQSSLAFLGCGAVRVLFARC